MRGRYYYHLIHLLEPFKNGIWLVYVYNISYTNHFYQYNQIYCERSKVMLALICNTNLLLWKEGCSGECSKIFQNF